jgi:hypothetical protein
VKCNSGTLTNVSGTDEADMLDDVCVLTSRRPPALTAGSERISRLVRT